MDIAAWLQSLGLGRYGEAFRENEIDADILPKLTTDDLRDIGVIAVGHRRKLLEAIAALAHPASDSDAAAASVVQSAKPIEAERRQLTVMFCDLVGSTALSAHLDPEDMHDLIRAYQNTVAGEIGRFEGHIAKFVGDGVLAYFGYPRAHEDEVERAVRAGLALVKAIGQMNAPTGEALAARIGIATGLVVVGDLVGEGPAQEQSVVGETPNLAARLQNIASPGRVVIAEATRRLLGSDFEVEDLGKHELKGLDDPVSAFAVIAERPTVSRFDAMSRHQLLPMVARDQELALLLERWALAKKGEGQGVLLVGEAGIGKSRISRALLDRLAQEQHKNVRYQCSPYHRDSALWPVVQQLGHEAGLDADEGSEAKLDKLEALLDRSGRRDSAPLIAELIGLDGAERYGDLEMTAQVRRARTLTVLVDQLLGLAAKQPVLVVVEDAHWIDPTTLELIEQYLDRIMNVPILIVMTSRPDQQPALAAHPNITRLTLNRLSRAGIEAIIMRLGSRTLDSQIVDAIIARSDGVPLFVEELTKAVLETGVTSIPASLHDSLMARLDRMTEVKEVAQIAACIGREFDNALLAKVVDGEEQDLQSALQQLVNAELIFHRRGVSSGTRYTFKHALVRDTAYASLLRRRRQELHRRIASVLERDFPQTAESQPELLAHHFTEAGETEQASLYWRRAGEQASASSANIEAIAYLAKGLELIAEMPEGHSRDQHELLLQMAIAVPILATEGYSAPEVEQAYARAADLCSKLNRSREFFPVLRGLWNCHLVRSNLDRALELAEQVASHAEDADNPQQLALGRRALGSTLFFLGRFEEAAAEFNQGIMIDDGAEQMENDHTLLSLYAERASVVCRTYLAKCLWYLGYPDRALATVKEGVALGRQLGHAHSTAFAMDMAAIVQICRRDFADAQSWADAAVNVAEEHGLSQWHAMGTILQGFALTGVGQHKQGLELLHKGHTAWHAIGAYLLDTQWLGYVAATHLQAGEFDKALDVLDKAIAAVPATSQTYYQAELLRLRGETLERLNRADESEAALMEAIAIARSQKARSSELRAATTLGRLWSRQNKRGQAADLLTPIYRWFTEGFKTSDLREAKALLDKLTV